MSENSPQQDNNRLSEVDSEQNRSVYSDNYSFSSQFMQNLPDLYSSNPQIQNYQQEDFKPHISIVYIMKKKLAQIAQKDYKPPIFINDFSNKMDPLIGRRKQSLQKQDQMLDEKELLFMQSNEQFGHEQSHGPQLPLQPQQGQMNMIQNGEVHHDVILQDMVDLQQWIAFIQQIYRPNYPQQPQILHNPFIHVAQQIGNADQINLNGQNIHQAHYPLGMNRNLQVVIGNHHMLRNQENLNNVIEPANSRNTRINFNTIPKLIFKSILLIVKYKVRLERIEIDYDDLDKSDQIRAILKRLIHSFKVLRYGDCSKIALTLYFNPFDQILHQKIRRKRCDYDYLTPYLRVLKNVSDRMKENIRKYFAKEICKYLDQKTIKDLVQNHPNISPLQKKAFRICFIHFYNALRTDDIIPSRISKPNFWRDFNRENNQILT